MGECPEELVKAYMLLERESSQERYLTKWLWAERTKEETDPSETFLWMTSGNRRCPVWCCKYTHFHKRGTKIHTQLEKRNLRHYVPFTEKKAHGCLEYCAALTTGCQNSQSFSWNAEIYMLSMLVMLSLDLQLFPCNHSLFSFPVELQI